MSIKVVPPVVKNTVDVVQRTGNIITHPLRQAVEDFFIFPRSNKATQILLALHYRELALRNRPLPKLQDVAFRAYSQFGEDGILLYLFSLLGTTNKKCVEICGGSGYDNTANLLINHGWTGLFFDGSHKHIQQGRQFYARCADTKVWPPQFVHAWVTAENINSLLERQGYTGEVDLMSLDMDGMDYWIWQAIECIRPRVIVLEYNTALGPDLSLTIPYQANFTTNANNVSALRFLGRRIMNTFISKPLADRIDHYYGASLSAFVKLGQQKGYRLIGCERYGYNAFFVRDDVGADLLPTVKPADCFKHPFTQYLSEIRRQTVMHREWLEV